jgi:hypothetical protein
MGQNWTCPFCARPQTLTNGQLRDVTTYINLQSHKYGEVALDIKAYACANPDCQDVTIVAALTKGKLMGTPYRYFSDEVIETYALRPSSSSKPQPEYIPEPLREDYYEACSIRDLSPKASATLSRRCLQGMIRDFCGISRGTLFDEIAALRKQADAGAAPKGVEPESVEAIDHVRSIGNIGAHMEKDINVIVDVEPGEAQALIELIELLFDEWYVARRKREDRLGRVKEIKVQKDGVISAAKAAKSEDSST